MKSADEKLDEAEWAVWYQLSMLERWRVTEKLWQYYLSAGGSLDPEPDPQSPFYFGEDVDRTPPERQPDVRSVWRGQMRKRLKHL